MHGLPSRVRLYQKRNRRGDGRISHFKPFNASVELINGRYLLLLHNQDRLFLVRPFKGTAAADLPVLIIPWDQVGLIRVLAEYTNCE
jgi:hypothetical protein